MVDVVMLGLMLVHVFAAAFWIGGLMFMGMVVAPTLEKAGPQVQGPTMMALGPKISFIMPATGILVLVTGLGNLYVRDSLSVAALTTGEWGRTILIVLLITLGMLGIGYGVSLPAFKTMQAEAAKTKPGEAPSAAMVKARASLRKGMMGAVTLGMLALLLMTYAAYGVGT